MERTAMPMWLMALTGVMVRSLLRFNAGSAGGAAIGGAAAPGCLELDEDLAWLDGVAGLGVELRDGAGGGRRDDGLHLHRLQDQQDVVDRDGLPDLDGDGGDDARQGAPAGLPLVGHGGRAGARRGRGGWRG